MKGVLLMAYGAPEKTEDIAGFYTDIRGGKPPSEELLKALTKRYELIGGRSPLPGITTKQAKALQTQLGSSHRVYIGMRHWRPKIKAAITAMQNDGITEAIAIVMAPHYSKMSVEKYFTEVKNAHDNDIVFQKISSWHTHPKYIEAIKTKVDQAVKKFSPEEQESLLVVFTAHSLPEKILEWQDPYPEQLFETCILLAHELKLKNWTLAYQSAGHTDEPWLRPNISEIIKSQKGPILVCVIGFVSDHLEVLYDIDIEAMAIARSEGIHLERIEMLNDSPLLIECLADLVKS